MEDLSSKEITYPVEDLVSIFRQDPFSKLFGKLTILTSAPVADDGGFPRHLAVLSADEPNYFELAIHPDGFTKEDFFDLRERVQVLEEGADVTIAGNPHVIAIFASCMIMEDHEVQIMRFTFEIDPFA